MLLIVEKGVRRGTYHSMPRYIKANNYDMEILDENKYFATKIISMEKNVRKVACRWIWKRIKHPNLVKLLW